MSAHNKTATTGVRADPWCHVTGVNHQGTFHEPDVEVSQILKEEIIQQASTAVYWLDSLHIRVNDDSAFGV